MRSILSLVLTAVCISLGTSFQSPSPVVLSRSKSFTATTTPASWTTTHNTPATTINLQRSKVSLAAVGTDDDDETDKNWEINPLFATLAAILFSYAFVFSPGELFGAVDNDLLQAFIENPTDPQGITPGFVAVFNFLGVMPLVLASLIFPQGSNKGLPAAPFCLSSVGAGFFGLAPYLIFRAPPVSTKTQSEMAWVSRNVLENKLFSWGLVALCVSVVAVSGVVGSEHHLLEEYMSLLQTSKLVAISTADLTVLTISAAALIPKDYQLRTTTTTDEEEESSKKGPILAAATVLFPVLGAALYCALRPPLPEE